MVTVSDRNRDRGQLLLVGAITLAFIILGAVVVYNGVLATETLSSGPTGQSGSDAKVTNEELEHGIQGVAHRGNIYWGNNSNGDYNDTLQQVIEGSGGGDSGYAETYLNTTANSRPTATRVDTIRVVKEARVSTNDISSESLDLINNDSAINTTRQVGHLALEFDPSGSTGDMTVRAVNSTGSSKEVTFEDTTSGYTIQSEPCDINQPVRVDLVRGTLNETREGCGLALIDPDESYDELVLTENDNIDGSYELVVKGEQDIDGISDVDYGAWDIAVDVTYTSNEISYTRLQRIPIYGEGTQNPLGLVPTGTCSDLDIHTNSPDIPAGEIIECDIIDDGDGISVGYNSNGILIGDLNIEDSLDVDNNGAFYGTAITTSTVDIDDGTVNGEIVAQGDVDMSSDSVVYGDVYTESSADIDGGVVYGDVIAEGSVDLNSGSGTVHGTVEEGVSDIDNYR